MCLVSVLFVKRGHPRLVLGAGRELWALLFSRFQGIRNDLTDQQSRTLGQLK